MERAHRAVASAKLLLADNDIDGACNRAYYAMFDAARAALALSSAAIEPTDIKTHSGLISAFSLNLVKPGHLPLELGKMLNRVAELRLVTDYMGGVVTKENAQSAVDHAITFVETIAHAFARELQR